MKEKYSLVGISPEKFANKDFSKYNFDFSDISAKQWLAAKNVINSILSSSMDFSKIPPEAFEGKNMYGVDFQKQTYPQYNGYRLIM